MGAIAIAVLLRMMRFLRQSRDGYAGYAGCSSITLVTRSRRLMLRLTHWMRKRRHSDADPSNVRAEFARDLFAQLSDEWEKLGLGRTGSSGTRGPAEQS